MVKLADSFHSLPACLEHRNYQIQLLQSFLDPVDVEEENELDKEVNKGDEWKRRRTKRGVGTTSSRHAHMLCTLELEL